MGHKRSLDEANGSKNNEKKNDKKSITPPSSAKKRKKEEVPPNQFTLNNFLAKKSPNRQSPNNTSTSSEQSSFSSTPNHNRDPGVISLLSQDDIMHEPQQTPTSLNNSAMSMNQTPLSGAGSRLTTSLSPLPENFSTPNGEEQGNLKFSIPNTALDFSNSFNSSFNSVDASPVNSEQNDHPDQAAPFQNPEPITPKKTIKKRKFNCPYYTNFLMTILNTQMSVHSHVFNEEERGIVEIFRNKFMRILLNNQKIDEKYFPEGHCTSSPKEIEIFGQNCQALLARLNPRKVQWHQPCDLLKKYEEEFSNYNHLFLKNTQNSQSSQGSDRTASATAIPGLLLEEEISPSQQSQFEENVSKTCTSIPKLLQFLVENNYMEGLKSPTELLEEKENEIMEMKANTPCSIEQQLKRKLKILSKEFQLEFYGKQAVEEQEYNQKFIDELKIYELDEYYGIILSTMTMKELQPIYDTMKKKNLFIYLLPTQSKVTKLNSRAACTKEHLLKQFNARNQFEEKQTEGTTQKKVEAFFRKEPPKPQSRFETVMNFYEKLYQEIVRVVHQKNIDLYKDSADDLSKLPPLVKIHSDVQSVLKNLTKLYFFHQKQQNGNTLMILTDLLRKKKFPKYDYKPTSLFESRDELLEFLFSRLFAKFYILAGESNELSNFSKRGNGRYDFSYHYFRSTELCMDDQAMNELIMGGKDGEAPDPEKQPKITQLASLPSFSADDLGETSEESSKTHPRVDTVKMDPELQQLFFGFSAIPSKTPKNSFSPSTSSSPPSHSTPPALSPPSSSPPMGKSPDKNSFAQEQALRERIAKVYEFLKRKLLQLFQKEREYLKDKEIKDYFSLHVRSGECFAHLLKRTGEFNESMRNYGETIPLFKQIIESPFLPNAKGPLLCRIFIDSANRGKDLLPIEKETYLRDAYDFVVSILKNPIISPCLRMYSLVGLEKRVKKIEKQLGIQKPFNFYDPNCPIFDPKSTTKYRALNDKLTKYQDIHIRGLWNAAMIGVSGKKSQFFSIYAAPLPKIETTSASPVSSAAQKPIPRQIPTSAFFHNSAKETEKMEVEKEEDKNMSVPLFPTNQHTANLLSSSSSSPLSSPTDSVQVNFKKELKKLVNVKQEVIVKKEPIKAHPTPMEVEKDVKVKQEAVDVKKEDEKDEDDVKLHSQEFEDQNGSTCSQNLLCESQGINNSISYPYLSSASSGATSSFGSSAGLSSMESLNICHSASSNEEDEEMASSEIDRINHETGVDMALQALTKQKAFGELNTIVPDNSSSKTSNDDVQATDLEEAVRGGLLPEESKKERKSSIRMKAQSSNSKSPILIEDSSAPIKKEAKKAKLEVPDVIDLDDSQPKEKFAKENKPPAPREVIDLCDSQNSQNSQQNAEQNQQPAHDVIDPNVYQNILQNQQQMAAVHEEQMKIQQEMIILEEQKRIQQERAALEQEELVKVYSVEELAIVYYERARNLHSIHSEGSVFVTIWFLLFWDIIYTNQAPAAAFQSKYQTAPLDFSSIEFYLNRKSLIDDFVTQIETSNFKFVAEKIVKSYYTHFGEECRLNPHWEDIDLQELLDICCSFGNSAIAVICKQFCEGFAGNRAGMPDLICYKSGICPKLTKKKEILEKEEEDRKRQASNLADMDSQRLVEQLLLDHAKQQIISSSDDEQSVKPQDFVDLDLSFGGKIEDLNTLAKKPVGVLSEVKGPSDTLSDKQKIWLQLLSNNGVVCEVCHIHDINDALNEPSVLNKQKKPKKSFKSNNNIYHDESLLDIPRYEKLNKILQLKMLQLQKKQI